MAWKLISGCQLVIMLYTSIGKSVVRGRAVRQSWFLLMIVFVLPCCAGCAIRTWQSVSVTCKQDVFPAREYPEASESHQTVGVDSSAIERTAEKNSDMTAAVAETFQTHDGVGLWTLVAIVLISLLFYYGICAICRKRRLATVFKLVLLWIGICYFLVHWFVSSFLTTLPSLLSVHIAVFSELVVGIMLFVALLTWRRALRRRFSDCSAKLRL